MFQESLHSFCGHPFLPIYPYNSSIPSDAIKLLKSAFYFLRAITHKAFPVQLRLFEKKATFLQIYDLIGNITGCANNFVYVPSPFTTGVPIADTIMLVSSLALKESCVWNRFFLLFFVQQQTVVHCLPGMRSPAQIHRTSCPSVPLLYSQTY